jgi:4-oxalocrotonate tautomerase
MGINPLAGNQTQLPHQEEPTLPLIRISMFPGKDPHQKAELVRRVTDTYLEVCGRPEQTADSVWVILDEVPSQNWAVGGKVGTA